MILASDQEFSERGEVLGDTRVAAELHDRLLHHAIVAEIARNRHRSREHAKLVPDNPPPATHLGTGNSNMTS